MLSNVQIQQNDIYTIKRHTENHIFINCRCELWYNFWISLVKMYRVACCNLEWVSVTHVCNWKHCLLSLTPVSLVWKHLLNAPFQQDLSVQYMCVGGDLLQAVSLKKKRGLCNFKWRQKSLLHRWYMTAAKWGLCTMWWIWLMFPVLFSPKWPRCFLERRLLKQWFCWLLC